MKLLIILILLLSFAQAQEIKTEDLTPEESQKISDQMLELQNLQLRLQNLQIQLQQTDQQLTKVRFTYTAYEKELATKYEKEDCTLSLKRDWICHSAEVEESKNEIKK